MKGSSFAFFNLGGVDFFRQRTSNTDLHLLGRLPGDSIRGYAWLRSHCWTPKAKGVLSPPEPDAPACLDKWPKKKRSPQGKVFALQALLVSTRLSWRLLLVSMVV